MSDRQLHLLLLLAALARVAASHGVPGSDVLATALERNDECAQGSGAEGECALSAVQLRAGKRATRSAGEAPSLAGIIEEMLADQAPGCPRACPGLYQGALALAATDSASNGTEARDAICAHSEELRCVLEHRSRDVCGPAVQDMGASLLGVPTTLEGLENHCKDVPHSSAPSVASALQARASAGATALEKELLERTLARKEADPRCTHASEGQTCVPNHDGGHSNAYVYCSDHKRLSAGETSCEYKMGHMSWCQMYGSGLTKGFCDDPFCRNGGASQGDGKYCHKGMVVSCQGTSAPRVVERCSDRTYYSDFGDQQCQETAHYTCAGNFPHPFCQYMGTTRNCQQNGNYADAGFGSGL